jgi:hypothetical protein
MNEDPMNKKGYEQCLVCGVYYEPGKAHKCPVSVATQPIETILAQRQTRYKDFKDNAEVSQQIKDILHDRIEWENLSPTHKEAVEVIVQKVSRIVCGDPNYPDNWIDIQGYAKLAEQRCTN